MTQRFADLAAAGRALAPLVARALAGGEDVLLLGVAPDGLPVAREVAAVLGTSVVRLDLGRGDSGVTAPLPVPVEGRTVVVVDDGVETGTAALAVGAALRDGGVGRAVLAVPVCPREVQPRLAVRYDDVVAVVQPLVRRSLRWHYTPVTERGDSPRPEPE